MLNQEDNRLLTRTGPDAPMGVLFRCFWMPAALSSEMPCANAPPIRIHLLGETFVAFRDSRGQIGIVESHCPHRGADLFFGRNEEEGIRRSEARRVGKECVSPCRSRWSPYQ